MDALGLFCCSTVLGLFIAQSLIFTTEKDFVDNGFDKHTIWVENYLSFFEASRKKPQLQTAALLVYIFP